MEQFHKYYEAYSTQLKNTIQHEFCRTRDQYYLEHAGATLYSERQIQNVAANLCKNLYANPHAGSSSSKVTQDAVDIVRFEVLAHFNTTPDEYSLIFTSGATAALKLIAESFHYGDSSDRGTLVYLQDNHTSVLGMRQEAPAVQCLTIKEAFDIFSSESEPQVGQRDFDLESDNALFVYPAQSNFSGTKYPLSWVEKTQAGALNRVVCPQTSNWFVALDAASYASTNRLDLSRHRPDFVTISFYKMFGYPTGVGALLVKNSSAYVLDKRYYGGGTVLMALSLDNIMIPRPVLHERFEDGTLPFLSIIAIKEGFDTIKRLGLTFDTITSHTFSLAQYVYRNLSSLHHSNGRPAVILYHSTTFQTSRDQGGIVTFNLLRDNGDHVGYSEVLHLLNLFGVHLRTGCCCNPGACQYFLKLSSDEVRKHFDAGHVCGDQHDLVDGVPTGAVRVSFGYMSTKEEADKFLEVISNCFVAQPYIAKMPSDWQTWQQKYDNLFNPTRTKKTNHSRIKIKKNIASITESVGNISEDGFVDDYVRGELCQILLYPVKSCGEFSVSTRWPLTATGLKYDREWMIVNPMGVCITQKQNKKLCLIKPVIDLKKNALILTSAGHNDIGISMVPASLQTVNGSFCQSKVCGDSIVGYDCGDEVAEWLENVLESPGLRLLQQCTNDDEVNQRTYKGDDNLQLSLANKAQFLLINRTSVRWLMDRIPGDFSEDIDTTTQRFRPNFVVEFEQPFVENNYEEFYLEAVKFKCSGKCTRCQMICINQRTGKISKEPLQTLAREFKGRISFGVYLNRGDFNQNVCINIGDSVFGHKIVQ